MDDYFKLIIFNVIVILLSYTFKKHIIIFYIVIFSLMMLYMLILKNKLIEGQYGNMQENIYKSFNEFKSEESTGIELPLGKISKILEKMLEKMSGEKISENKCRGEFVVNKLTDKTCGEGFNERVYNIIDKGDGDCLHSNLYKEKVPLRSCKYNEKCTSDLDCKKGRCVDNLCTHGLDCNASILSGCDRDSCLALNSGLDRDIYYYTDNECNVDPCNENTYQLCDEGGCGSLSYKFKYNTDRSICEKVVEDVDDTGLRIGSYLNIVNRFKSIVGEEGSEKDICVDQGNKGDCTVGADLQPRYYCNDGYQNMPGENDSARGGPNECEECPSNTAGTGGTCRQCPDSHRPNDLRTMCVPKWRACGASLYHADSVNDGVSCTHPSQYWRTAFWSEVNDELICTRRPGDAPDIKISGDDTDGWCNTVACVDGYEDSMDSCRDCCYPCMSEDGANTKQINACNAAAERASGG
jgi:hypothetical protein